MKNKNQYVFPLITGILAGAASVYFLKSEKGQKMVEAAITKGSSIKDAIVENSQELVEKGNVVLNDVLEKSKEGVATAVEEANDLAQDKLTDFAAGIETAKIKLNQVKV